MTITTSGTHSLLRITCGTAVGLKWDSVGLCEQRAEPCVGEPYLLSQWGFKELGRLYRELWRLWTPEMGWGSPRQSRLKPAQNLGGGVGAALGFIDMVVGGAPTPPPKNPDESSAVPADRQYSTQTSVKHGRAS